MTIRGTGGPRGEALHEMGKEEETRATCIKCGVLEPDLSQPCPESLFGRRRRFKTEPEEPVLKQALNYP